MSVDFLNCVKCNAYTDIRMMSWVKRSDIKPDKTVAKVMMRVCPSCYSDLK